MKLTVIVPSYRRPDSLRRCLSAILGGTRSPDELVVVVRDTDPESQAAVDEMAADDGHGIVRRALVHEPGQVAAMNRGVAEASGDIIVFTDDDTEPTREWLERLEALYEDASVVGAGGRDRVEGSPDTEPAAEVGLLTWYGRLIGEHHRGCEGIRRVDHLKGANMSFRRSALPPFDPVLYRAAAVLNDTDVSLAARRHGLLLYDPDALVHHYPADRVDGVSRRMDDLDVVRVSSHNMAYCLLKHLAWWAKPVFVAYTLLVGHGAYFGLAKGLDAALHRRPNAFRQFWASTRGKLEGLQSYLRTRGGAAPAEPTTEAGDVP